MNETAQNGGEIGWVNEDFDSEFSKVCYNAAINDVFTYPQGSAIHILQVTEKSDLVNKVKLCVLQRKVEAGSKTTVNLYNKAAQYIAKNQTAEAFVTNAKASEGLNLTTITVAKDEPQVGNLPNSRNVLRWAFDNEAGKVTEEVFECGSNYVVVMLDNVLEKGILSLEAVKDKVKLAVMNDKKAAKIIADMKAAGDNLSSIGMTFMAQNVSFASDQIGSMGYEPMVAGAIPALIKTKQIQYVKGAAGVYAIKLLSEVPQDEFNAAKEIEMANMKNAAVSSVFMALKDKAEIIDNRINFY
jgi:peptidyl-prolyl cis-trans isomerase D